MKTLFIGDIVGRKARNFAIEKIKDFKDSKTFDLIIVNVENSAGGFGVTPEICENFLLNGADCMMAGIQDCDREIIENDLVWIRDETHKKPIAVGWALTDGKNMINSKSGKGISTIHWIGDELWSLEL